MSQPSQSETVLRESLDAVDRVRRRIMLAGYVAVAGTFAAFFWLDRVARTSNDIENVVMAAVLAITTVVGWSTFALAIFIGRMTKRVLRAIDLASKR